MASEALDSSNAGAGRRVLALKIAGRQEPGNPIYSTSIVELATGQANLTTVQERLEVVQARIAEVCARAHRSRESVTLIAVSKTHPAETVLEAVRAGQLHFGENRIEEAGDKIAAVRAGTVLNQPPAELTWHMVGHVQSRKAREVVAAFDWIHSLDSFKLAERYARFATEMGRSPYILLEVNVSGEVSKSGLDAANWEQDRAKRESLWDEIRRIIALPALRPAGLMTMAPIVENIEQARPVF